LDHCPPARAHVQLPRLLFSGRVLCVFDSEMVAIFCQAKVNSRQAADARTRKTKPLPAGREGNLHWRCKVCNAYFYITSVCLSPSPRATARRMEKGEMKTENRVELYTFKCIYFSRSQRQPQEPQDTCRHEYARKVWAKGCAGGQANWVEALNYYIDSLWVGKG